MVYQEHVYNLAKIYTGMGISVIPIQPKTKAPYHQLLKDVGWIDPKDNTPMWEPAQKEIVKPEIIRHWFGNGYNSGIALVGGSVSGNLIYFDWDDPEIYREWALAHKGYVNYTPVSKTSAGYHVFFRTEGELRGSHFYYKGKFAGHLRGQNLYVVAPPSYHPSGVQYRWLRHPQNGIKTIKNLAEIHIERTKPNTGGGQTTFNENYDTQPVQICDEALILKAQNDINGGLRFTSLWNGDISAYQSQSEADLALCRELAYWTGRDPVRIDNLFRRSGLMRDKWLRKWGNGTYGQKTISLACKSCSRVYEVSKQGNWTQI